MLPTTLMLPNGLTPDLQRVEDATGADSSLSLSTRGARVERASGEQPGIIFSVVVPKENGTSPGLHFHSQSVESSVRITATDVTNNKTANAFHIGTIVRGTGTAAKATFFVWGDGGGFALEIDPAGNAIVKHDLTVEGSVKVANMKIGDPARQTSLRNVMIDPATGTLFRVP